MPEPADSHFQGTCSFDVLYELQRTISLLHDTIHNLKAQLVALVHMSAPFTHAGQTEESSKAQVLALQLNTENEQCQLLKEARRRTLRTPVTRAGAPHAGPKGRHRHCAGHRQAAAAGLGLAFCQGAPRACVLPSQTTRL